jgi:hypothetical protein
LSSYWRTSQYFMEPEDSFPYSQKPSTILILSHDQSTKSHVQFPQLRPFNQRISPRPKPFVTFRNKLIFFLRWRVVRPTPNTQAWGTPLIGCPRLVVKYIRSYLPFLEAVPSIRNLRRHGMMARDPPNIVSYNNVNNNNNNNNNKNA